MVLSLSCFRTLFIRTTSTIAPEMATATYTKTPRSAAAGVRENACISNTNGVVSDGGMSD